MRFIDGAHARVSIWPPHVVYHKSVYSRIRTRRRRICRLKQTACLTLLLWERVRFEVRLAYTSNVSQKNECRPPPAVMRCMRLPVVCNRSARLCTAVNNEEHINVHVCVPPRGEHFKFVWIVYGTRSRPCAGTRFHVCGGTCRNAKFHLPSST